MDNLPHPDDSSDLGGRPEQSDVDKSKAQLIEELQALRRQLSDRTSLSDKTGRANTLRASGDRYRTLIDTIPHGVAECDLTGKMLFSSPAHARMLGCRPEDVVGTSIWDWIASADGKGMVQRAIHEALATRSVPPPYTVGTDTRDGRRIVTKVDWNYKCNSENDVIGFVAVVTDITDQVHMQEALRQGEDRYRTLVENIRQGITLVPIQAKAEGLCCRFLAVL
jgi:PAS domain S-box-containing protein